MMIGVILPPIAIFVGTSHMLATCCQLAVRLRLDFHKVPLHGSLRLFARHTNSIRNGYPILGYQQRTDISLN